MTQAVSTGPASNVPFVTPPGEGLAVWHLDTLMELKAPSAGTGGGLTVFEQLLPAGSSPPLHVHHGEDEAWYVVEGEVLFHIDGASLHAPVGTFVWAPRGLAHTFLVRSDHARLLVLLTPGGFEEFFAETGRPAPERTLPPPPDGPPDVVALTAGAQRHGCEIVGPPMGGP